MLNWFRIRKLIRILLTPIRIRIWIGVKMEIGIKTMPIHNTASCNTRISRSGSKNAILVKNQKGPVIKAERSPGSFSRQEWEYHRWEWGAARADWGPPWWGSEPAKSSVPVSVNIFLMDSDPDPRIWSLPGHFYGRWILFFKPRQLLWKKKYCHN